MGRLLYLTPCPAPSGGPRPPVGDPASLTGEGAEGRYTAKPQRTRSFAKTEAERGLNTEETEGDGVYRSDAGRVAHPLPAPSGDSTSPLGSGARRAALPF